jgi:type III secretion system YscQ/HrcQ family protein
VIEPRLLRSWVAHFASNPANLLQSKVSAGFELTLSVQMGSLSLTKKEWQSLKKGDCALLHRGNIHHAAVMLGPVPLFQAKIKQHKLHILDDPFTHEDSMEKHPEEPDSNKPVSLKELPLQITVEVARIQMTLEKLLQLEPGNIVDVSIDTTQPLRLTVNGQLIGHGELVHVGDALAIRLLDKG